MKRRLTGLLLFLLFLPFAAAASECKIKKVGELPVPDGYGTAGAYIGVINDAILVAGGSDFPSGFPWEGGQKQWSDRIYLVKKSASGYHASLLDEKFPVASGSGCTAYDGTHIWCFGGTDGKNTVRAVYRMGMSGGKVKIDSVSVLPEGFVPVAAICHKGGGSVCPWYGRFRECPVQIFPFFGNLDKDDGNAGSLDKRSRLIRITAQW